MLDSYLCLLYIVSNFLHEPLVNQVGFLVLQESVQNVARKLPYDQKRLPVSI